MITPNFRFCLIRYGVQPDWLVLWMLDRVRHDREAYKRNCNTSQRLVILSGLSTVQGINPAGDGLERAGGLNFH